MVKKNHRVISFECPEDLFFELKKRAFWEKESQSAVIVRSLEDFLSFPGKKEGLQ